MRATSCSAISFSPGLLTLELKRIALQLVTRIRKRVQERRKNHRGETFDKLSKQYEKYKMNDMRLFNDRGDRKAGDRLPAYEGVSIESKAGGSANITLTGKTMDNLTFRGFISNGFRIGWSGRAGYIINKLEGVKNYQVIGTGTHVLTEGEERFIRQEYTVLINKNIDDYCRENIKIPLGTKP